MDKALQDTIEKIKTLATKDAEFASEMRNLFGKTDSASSVFTPSGIEDDVMAIREALEIRANKSVNYDFVNDQRLRDQLIIDNLRMENAALNLQESEEERFYVFCVNAFYQLENIVNYYFFITYPDFNNLQDVVEEYTKNEPSEDFRYKRREREMLAIFQLLIKSMHYVICYSPMTHLRLLWVHCGKFAMKESIAAW